MLSLFNTVNHPKSHIYVHLHEDGTSTFWMDLSFLKDDFNTHFLKRMFKCHEKAIRAQNVSPGIYKFNVERKGWRFEWQLEPFFDFNLNI